MKRENVIKGKRNEIVEMKKSDRKKKKKDKKE